MNDNNRKFQPEQKLIWKNGPPGSGFVTVMEYDENDPDLVTVKDSRGQLHTVQESELIDP